ncbi:MAG: 4Fe-4S double cluster binding domain-containing protein, partial [Planctomycetota bacterium]
LERDLASGAGVGRVGKHTLLIEPKRGSWAVLGVLLTTVPFEMDATLNEDPCGTCTRCIEACPTDAIEPWKVDARRCISYLTLEHRSAIPAGLHEGLGDWLAGCDICQEVCPHNQPTTARANTPHAESLKPSRQGFDLLEVLGWTEEDRRVAFQGSALKRVKYDALKRNALILLTNKVCQGDLEAKPTLLKHLQDIEQSATASEVLRETVRVCRLRLE